MSKALHLYDESLPLVEDAVRKARDRGLQDIISVVAGGGVAIDRDLLHDRAVHYGRLDELLGRVVEANESE